MVVMAPGMKLLCAAVVASVARAVSPQALFQRVWGSHDLSTPPNKAEASLAFPKTYKLRLCNAYAWSAPLEMRRVQEPKLVEYPLPYKECHDYTIPLTDGDELQFRAGDLNIGTFTVKGLPKSPAMLLLVPHKKDSESMAVTFDSHMYAEGDYPQVALVDAFAGAERTNLYLKEKEHSETLSFSSVITLTPGQYEVGLGRNATGSPSFISLKAAQKEKYVVIRLGNSMNATEGTWSEDMVVFPHSSGAAAKAFGALVAVFACYALGGSEL